MDKESRSRTVSNLIRTLSPKIGVQILPADVRVVTRRPPKPAAVDTAGSTGTRLPTTTGSVILRLARKDTAGSVLQTQWTGEDTAIFDSQGRRCFTRLLGAPHLDDIERPVHQVWLRSSSFRGLTEADMWLRLAEGLLPAYDQPQPCEAAADQPAATPADALALAGVRAWAEYEADTDADDAVICPPTRTLLALMAVREIWKARRSADSALLELLDPEAARLLYDVYRDAVLALPFGDQSQGRAVIQVTVEHSEDREDQPTTPLPGVLPLALPKQFFRCALTAQAICTGPLTNLELPTVEQLAEAITATISQRTNTLPELHHAQWLTDTMTVAGVEMHHYHTEPTLLRVGDNNLCAISLGKEDEEFADSLRMAVALTSPVALLRAIRLRWIVIYLTESEFDPSEVLIHPFNQTILEAGELGGNTGHNQIRRAAIGMRKKARKTAPASLALRATGRPIYTLTLQLTAYHHSIIGGTRSTDRTEEWRKTMSTTPNRTTSSSDPSSPDRTPATAPAATATTGAHADDEEELDLNYEEMDSAMEGDTTQAELASHAAETHQLLNPQRLSIQLEHHPSQPTPASKSKTATAIKLKKKQPRGRSRSDGATRNRSRSKPRLSGTRGSDSEWETNDDANQPSSSSHQ
eukprot:jgi/Tetstr1/436930/TSEL_025703.t1